VRADSLVLALAAAALLPACHATTTPIADGERFSPEITNAYLPLSLVRYAELQGDEGWIVLAVAERTRTVGGVECLVLVEQEYAGGELTELSSSYLAQDDGGNVWSFGEAIEEFQAGQVVGHGGSWLVGLDATEPSLMMPAAPRLGQRFGPGGLTAGAGPFDEVDALDVELTVPAGRFQGVLVVKTGAGASTERRYYAPGVGLISQDEKLNLNTVGPLGAVTP
jgi:hypothetical protein